MVSTAVEEAALKNGASLKSKTKTGQEEECQAGSVKNGLVTDDSSQNSVTSDKAKSAPNGDQNGEHNTDAKDVEENEDEGDYEIEEFDEQPQIIIDDDEPEKVEAVDKSAADGSAEKSSASADDISQNDTKDLKKGNDPAASKDIESETKEIGKDSDEIAKPQEASPEQWPDPDLSGQDCVDDVRKLDKGLPKFLIRRVKVGRWTPCETPKGGEFKMRDNESLVEVPSLTCPFLLKEKDVFARRVKDGKVLPPKPRKVPAPSQSQFKLGQTSVVDFFSSSAGEFLTQIGLDRVSEHYSKDQIKQKEREMRRHGRSAELLESAKRHAEQFQRTKARNAAFHHKLKRCQTCDFKTESQLVLEGHLLTPHFTQRRDLQCSFCPFITRDAKAIIFHMEAHHGKVPVMEPPPQFYECPFCPFETNLKNKAGTHVNRCQRYFNNNVNQSPGNDFQAPGMTSKPINNDDIKMYEKFFLALTQAKNQAVAQAAQTTAQQRQQLLLAAAASRGNGARGGSNVLYQQLQSMASNSAGGVRPAGVQPPAGRIPAAISQPSPSVATTTSNTAAAVAARMQQQQQAANAQASLLQQAQALAAGSATLLNGNVVSNGGLSALAQSRAAAAANLARLPAPQQQHLQTHQPDAIAATMAAGSGSGGSNVGPAMAGAGGSGVVPKDIFIDEYDYKYKFKQFSADGSSRWCCTTRKCKAAFVIPRGESKPRFPVGPEMHNHKPFSKLAADSSSPMDAGTTSAGSAAAAAAAAAGNNPGAAAAAQLAAAGVNIQALVALTNGGTNTQALLTALTTAARGNGPQSVQAQALLNALGNKDAAAKLAQAASAAASAAAAAATAAAQQQQQRQQQQANRAAGLAAAAMAGSSIGGARSASLGAAVGGSLADGLVPDKAELVPGVATRLSAPGTGRAPVILESSGQGTTNAQSGAGAFVICEICDGYIKDLDQLRTHMQWIHKVKIHPKMLASRPPLSCQKCQWRFFTDQGLERHLLGAHGLVTSNMQELANNSQDGGRCTVCGRIYASKLVAHMNQVHRVALKPAHLSYKCTVCTATFNLYRLFESHVYSVHSGAMKRGSATNNDQSAAKRVRKEDQQPQRREDAGASGLNLSINPAVGGSGGIGSKATSSVNAVVPSTEPIYPKTCTLCNGIRVDDWLSHLAEKHMAKSVKVGVCQIEKCSSCLSNFDGMVVMNSGLGESSSSSSDDDDE